MSRDYNSAGWGCQGSHSDSLSLKTRRGRRLDGSPAGFGSAYPGTSRTEEWNKALQSFRRLVAFLSTHLICKSL